MHVSASKPDAGMGRLLEGAQFSDAYDLAVDTSGLDATAAARRMMERTPRWVTGLLVLRNAIVAPFGLKSASPRQMPSPDRIGFFPVVSETRERVVLGFDDRHLDFRVVVDVVHRSDARRVIATTLVRTHNLFGRAYLAAVLPFHRLIVPAMLKQVARA